MAKFDIDLYSYDDIDVDITPSEFIDECNESEKNELINELKGQGYILDIEIDNTPINKEYNNAVHKLFYLREFMSKEDEQIIIEIAKKY